MFIISTIKIPKNARLVPGEIGMDTAIANREYIRNELNKSMIEANDPNTKRLGHNEVMSNLKKQREARNRHGL